MNNEGAFNKKLSICIPTYNRADALKECLENIIPQVKNYSIPIYVSDDASTDNTNEIVLEFRKIYPFIYYSCNAVTLSPDYNFKHVLKMSQCEYAWLLGDRSRIIDGAIEQILNIVDHKNYDLIVVNGGELKSLYSQEFIPKVKSLKTKVFKDRDEFLGQLGWYITWMSCLIFGQGVRQCGDFDSFGGTGFIHAGVVLKYLSETDFSVYWDSTMRVYNVNTVVSGWAVNNTVFEVFTAKWYQLIQSLPHFKKKARLAALKGITFGNKIFSLKSMLYLRAIGQYDLNILKKYGFFLSYTTYIPKIILVIIALTPPIFLNVLRTLRRVLFKSS
jgi:glycosyltransferase involved in cell wall biosynthesis